MTTMTQSDPAAEDAVARDGLTIGTDRLTVSFGSTTALDEVSLDLAPGRIHGLLGRNGAGKTTLLSVLASLLPASAGTVHLDGTDPFENEHLMSQVCLIRDCGDVIASERISWNLDFQAMARPTFDRAWAQELVESFGLSARTKPTQLSRGQRSALGISIGLASRAPLTMFDEPHLGLDAPSRDLFAELLLADFAEHPRTIMLSSHLIGEVEPLLETVTILHRGRVLLSAESDDVRARGLTVTGPTNRVDALASGLHVIATQDLGPTRRITAYGQADPDLLASAERDGLTIAAAPLHDLVVHLTGEPS